MAVYEQSVGATDEWYTPSYVFQAMGVRFDCDPTPGPEWTPAREWCERHGEWRGFTWLNPPFGGRNDLAPWLERFFAHGDGVALVPDRTSASWWQAYAPRSDVVLFVARRIKFIGFDGAIGRSPAQGTCLLASGPRGTKALVNAARNGLGVAFKQKDFDNA